MERFAGLGLTGVKLTGTILRVETAAVRLRSQMDKRDEESELSIDDLEFKFNESGHGIVAADAFDDIEETTDILNGCAFPLLRPNGSSHALAPQTPS